MCIRDREALRTVQSGATLSRSESREVFGAALGGGEEPERIALGALVASLAQRGERPEEISGAADALRDAMLPFEHDHPEAIDTCGTGGDGLETFNLSTAAAIVAAAAGAKVIKHGGRSVSSRCGSADLLEALGIPLELSPEAAREVLDEVGITFLFAPRYHPAMRHAAPVRQALGVRTLFNFLGPICNPGRVRRQLLGVGDGSRLADFQAVLEETGLERGYVVHGAGGADELTAAGANRALPVGSAPEECLDAEALGLSTSPVDALRGGDTTENLRLLHLLLDPDSTEREPLREVLALNAGAALVVAGVAGGAQEGLGLARETLLSGAARQRLEQWVVACRRVAGGAQA